MALAVKSEAPPLTADKDGTLRISGTRVLLDLVIEAFKAGATPEGIQESYDSLKLADVYAVIAYYLRHSAEVDQYLAKRAAESQEIRREIEANQDLSETRARLRTGQPFAGVFVLGDDMPLGQPFPAHPFVDPDGGEGRSAAFGGGVIARRSRLIARSRLRACGTWGRGF